MIKIINTAIASSTMFATSEAIAITWIAKYNFIVLWRKCDFFIMFTPFVIIDHSIGGVDNGG